MLHVLLGKLTPGLSLRVALKDLTQSPPAAVGREANVQPELPYWSNPEVTRMTLGAETLSLGR